MCRLGLVSWILLAACALSVLMLRATLHSLSRLQQEAIVPASVRRADERVLNFASSYVVPIVIALFGGIEATRLGRPLVLVALMALIYVRAGLFHLAPTLSVMGYRV